MRPRDVIYFDFAATTPLDERVLQIMQPYWNEAFGNPSSIHAYGQTAEATLDDARQLSAAFLNARPAEILFTSGGTESDNLALRGVALARRAQTGADTLLISPVEHPAVTQTARQLVDVFGFKLKFLPTDCYGQVEAQSVEAELCDGTALVSVIYANNEIGSINPIAEIGAICRQRNIPFHSDAVQAAAHLPMNVAADAVDLLSIGAHKLYGPKGVGALYVRAGTPLLNLQTGGGQENGRRAGTENIAYIAGMAEALRLTREEAPGRRQQMICLRDEIIQQVLSIIPGAVLTGHPSNRLPNHASFALDHVNGNLLLMLLDQAGFACSSGSACKVGNPKPSEVLAVLGLPASYAYGSLRITLGKTSTQEEVEKLLTTLPGLVARARKLKTGEA